MADSNITKRALAAAMKELMAEMPFEKINVAQICEKCGMNRKSFYYHFRDKYDLVNWIYDTEFITVVTKKHFDSTWDYMLVMFQYLYDNRGFYRKALKIEGQNSFPEHFREVLHPLVERRLREILVGEEIQEFHINFFADAFVCAIERWIMEQDCMPPEQFTALVRSCIQRTAEIVYNEMNPAPGSETQ